MFRRRARSGGPRLFPDAPPPRTAHEDPPAASAQSVVVVGRYSTPFGSAPERVAVAELAERLKKSVHDSGDGAHAGTDADREREWSVSFSGPDAYRLARPVEAALRDGHPFGEVVCVRRYGPLGADADAVGAVFPGTGEVVP